MLTCSSTLHYLLHLLTFCILHFSLIKKTPPPKKILTSLFTNYFVLNLKELQGSPQKPHIYHEPPNLYSLPQNNLYSPPQNSFYSLPQSSFYSPPQSSLYSPPQNSLYSPPQNSLYSPPQNSLYSQPQNNQPENGFRKGSPDLVIQHIHKPTFLSGDKSCCS